MIKTNFNSPKMWYFRRDAWLWNLSDPTMHGQDEPEEIAKFERSLPYWRTSNSRAETIAMHSTLLSIVADD